MHFSLVEENALVQGNHTHDSFRMRLILSLSVQSLDCFFLFHANLQNFISGKVYQCVNI